MNHSLFKFQKNLFNIFITGLCLIILSCGDDNNGSGGGAPPSGVVPAASTKMNVAVNQAFAQTQSTSVLGQYEDTAARTRAQSSCSWIPDHLINLYYYGDISKVWDAGCFNNSNKKDGTLSTRDFVATLLDPSVTNIATNGPNVLNSLESKLLIPCIISLVLPADKYDDLAGLPEPREEPYNFTITQEIITSAEQNCGGLLNQDLEGMDMTLKVDQIGIPGDTFYIRAQLDKSRDGEALETSYYYFGSNVADTETGNPYINIGWETRPENPFAMGYSLVIYKSPKEIRFEQMVEYNSTGSTPPNYNDPCNKVNFFRAFVDENNTYMVGQSNQNPHTLYTIAGSQGAPEANNTKVSLWSPVSFLQTADKDTGRYPWTTPIIWNEIIYPYNGCISYPSGTITSCSSEPDISPLGLDEIIGNKFAILADSLVPEDLWYEIKSHSDLKFSNESSVFTAEPFADIANHVPADCTIPPAFLNSIPWRQ